MLPRNVNRFAWIWIISFLLEFPDIFLTPSVLVERARIAHHWSGEVKLFIGTMFLVLAIQFPFFQSAVWGRKNWARWVLLLAFAASLPFMFLEPRMFREDYLPQTLYGFAATLLEAVGFYFLFTGDARPWFGRQIRNEPLPTAHTS
jgi:hypothetical protein